ncbi:MAG TPA: dipeptide/oligopeptide/nickel ABC transporter permease/ATP-binding protein [Pedococcus sp.]|jgi:peptide/nickel transport system permease protein|nr:dipeptide/oligopeptide/nickel ABC transporter permease/ATP-binding protein [Pedococcus sp.]
MTATSVQIEVPAEPLPGGGPASPPHFFRQVLRNPRGGLAITYLVLLVVAGLFADALSKYAPDKQDLNVVLTGPSGEHLLGADTLGRDVLSRLLHGIMPSLENSAIALIVFLVIGVPFGILAGYMGGRLDAIVSRVTELVMAVPPIILVLVVLAVFSSSATAAMVALGALLAPGLVRVVRGATLVVREELFVTAAKVAGVRPPRIMATHVTRHVLGPILAQATIFAGVSLAVQAALGFLGLLGSSDHPTWGGMIGEASQVITQTSWLLFPPGALLAVTVLAFGLLGDTIRDVASGELPTSRPRGDMPKRQSEGVRQAVGGLSLDPESLFAVRGLEITTDAGVVLVDDASFSVSAGQTVALVGESGCGKSMTALAMLGLLPAGVAVTGGQVIFNAVDLQAGGATAYREVRGTGIAYIAQDALGSLDPTHTVGSHLREVIRCHETLNKAAARARSRELLSQVKIPDPDRVLAAYPHEISGGMAQRVNIAIALAGRPQLIIADEPTTALDVTVQAEILRLLAELRDTTGMALLLITHDWGVVADIADRGVVMYAGEVVEQADVNVLFKTPRFPYTAALLAADPSLALEGARLPTLAGRVPPPGSWPVGCRFASRCSFATDACTGGPIPLIALPTASVTRCIRVDELVKQGALPR